MCDTKRITRLERAWCEGACVRYCNNSAQIKFQTSSPNLKLKTSRDMNRRLMSISTLLVFSTARQCIYRQKKESSPWPCLAVIRSRCDLRKALVRLLARNIVLPQLLQLLLFLCARLLLVLLDQRRQVCASMPCGDVPRAAGV